MEAPEKTEGDPPVHRVLYAGSGWVRRQRLLCNSRPRDCNNMLNKKVIAICGRGQSGKSTAAGLLAHKAEYRSFSFADPIKRMLLTFGQGLGMEPRHLFGSDRDKNEPLAILGGKSSRYAMQTLGTEWRELIDKDLWVNHMGHRLRQSDANRIVIDDMRFLHEYEAMKALGVTIVGIESPRQGVANSTHASEQWDFKSTGMPVIQNDGTVNDLWVKLQPYL